MRELDIDVVARTIFGEARGEYYRPDGGISALISVANVMRNRVEGSKRFGKTYQEVCRKPYQFSCWNPRDPNALLVARIQRGEDRLFDICLKVAENVIDGVWPDITSGANHYHASWMKSYPAWAVGTVPSYRCGQHIFYKL